MATSTQIITRALRRLSILPPGGTAAAYQLTHGLDELNDMLDSFAADGVNIDPSVPIPAQFRAALIAKLALRLSSSYGEAAVVSPLLMKEADDGWKALQAAYVFAPNASFDIAIRRAPFQHILRNLESTGTEVSDDSSVSGFCTLTAGSPTTTVTNANCTATSTVTLTPYSEAAMHEWNEARPEVTAGAGSFEIVHLNNQLLDRIFEYLIVI